MNTLSNRRYRTPKGSRRKTALQYAILRPFFRDFFRENSKKVKELKAQKKEAFRRGDDSEGRSLHREHMILRAKISEYHSVYRKFKSQSKALYFHINSLPLHIRVEVMKYAQAVCLGS